MAGHGYRRVRECLKSYGAAFLVDPKIVVGLDTCRRCGYRIELHRELAPEFGLTVLVHNLTPEEAAGVDVVDLEATEELRSLLDGKTNT